MNFQKALEMTSADLYKINKPNAKLGKGTFVITHHKRKKKKERKNKKTQLY